MAATSTIQASASRHGRSLAVACLLSLAIHLTGGLALFQWWQQRPHLPEPPRSLAIRIAHATTQKGVKSEAAPPVTRPQQNTPENKIAKPRHKPVTRQTKPAKPRRKAAAPVITARNAPTPPAVTTTKAPAPNPVPEPVETTTPLSAPSPAPTPPATRASRPGGQAVQASIDDYRTAVRNGIERNKRYPRRDQRRRREGRAVVTFVIARNGNISRLRVIESSGHASLDRAARQAVEKIDGRFPIPAGLEREHWEFSVPIVFRLR